MRALFIGLLVCINIAVFSFHQERRLSVSFLDVGQGDAIFIEGPTGIQVLIDGGATRSVLRQLSAWVGFFDRDIDAVVATHPDQDHIGGLVDVLSRYETPLFIESGATSSTPVYAALENVLTENHVERILARRSMRILLGGGAYADILFPDRDVSGVDANTASIVMRVVYGENEFFLNGDSPKAIEEYLVDLDGSRLESDVLKAGHHGSKTSSDELFIKTINPIYVVYSRGCNNRYGHPSEEVVALYQSLRIESFDTCEDGTVTFQSDGKTIKIKTN